MSKVLFIPPSWDSLRYREHFAAEAEARGVEAVFVGEPLTLAHLTHPDKLVIAQSISAEIASQVDEDWIVLTMENPAGTADVFQSMHPDEGHLWAATHASAGLAMGGWLLELGARGHHASDDLAWPDLVLPGLVHMDVHEPPPLPTDTPLAVYDDIRIPVGKTWTWKAGVLGGENPAALRAGAWIDLTGHARHLVNGPHIFLPPGQWKAQLGVSIDIETSNPRFVCQWGGGAHATLVREIAVRHSGHYQVTMTTRLDWPDAVRFLFASKTALFSGRAKIGDLRVWREPLTPAPRAALTALAV